MQFYNPEAFSWLWIPALLFGIGLLSGRFWKQRVRSLGSQDVFAGKLMPDYRPGEAANRLIFLILAMLCFITALARPQWGESAKKIERKGTDILFLLDTSLSTLADDVKPNRMEVAKNKIKTIVRHLKGDRVGLVVFSGSAFLQTPFTLDYAAFFLFLDAVRVGHVPDPGSSLGASFQFVLKIFPQEELKHKVLILMTDGEDTAGGMDEALLALEQAHIRVYCVGMGTEAGGPIPLRDNAGRQTGFKKDRSGEIVITRLNPPLLEKIARQTGGLFLPTTASDQDVEVLLKHIGVSGARKIKEQTVIEKEDHYTLFLLLGLFFLLAELFVRRTRTLKNAAVFTALGFVFLSQCGFLETARGLNEKANKDFAEKKYQTAAEKYQKAKVKNPDDPAIRYNLGTALYEGRKYRETQPELKKALDTKEPGLKAKAYYNLGNTEYRLGNFDGAIQAYKEALKLDPADKDAKFNLEFVQKQKGAFDKKDADRQKDNPKQNQKNQQDNQSQPNQQNNQNQQDSQNQQNSQQNQKDQQDQAQNNSSQQNQDQNSQGGQSQQDQKNQGSQGQQGKPEPQSGQEGSQEPQNQKSEPSQSQKNKDQNSQGGQGQQDQKNQGSQGQQGKSEPPSGQSGPQDSEKKEQSSQEQAPQNTPDQKSQPQGQENQPSPPQPAQEKSQGEKPNELPQNQGESGKSEAGQEPKPQQSSPEAQSRQPQDQPASQSQEQPSTSGLPEESPSQNEAGEQPQPEGIGQEPQESAQNEPGQELGPQEEQAQPQGEAGEETREAGQDSSGNAEQSESEKPSGQGRSGGSLQGQMSKENALRILEALGDSEKEFNDLRRPPLHKDRPPVERDW